jgi:urease accessory protein
VRRIWVALLIPSVAAAHTGTGLAGGLISGFQHPFAGGDHLLAMVAVGLWGAVLGEPLVYALPVTFPLLMVAGAALGMFGVSVPSVELGIAVSVLVLGCCIAIPVRAPVGIAVLIVAGFAVFHGYAHGRELPSAADPVGYSAGFILATGLLHGVGIGVGLLTRSPGGMRIVRAIGACVAALGIGYLYAVVR